MPPAETVEALLLFLQFGHRELLQGQFFVDLGVELSAVRDELGPLLLTEFGERSFQPGGVPLAAAGRPQHHQLPATTGSELAHPGDARRETRHVRHRRRTLRRRHRPGFA